jgi:hypothetical protein
MDALRPAGEGGCSASAGSSSGDCRNTAPPGRRCFRVNRAPGYELDLSEQEATLTAGATVRLTFKLRKQ